MERAEIIGAQIQIDSHPQKGTKVLISWEAARESGSIH